ncbi:MAG: O-antigen ligase family protein [Clostridia bacterium]|nr:O-antigen ligase family protein [Clostridia bacterium]
MMENWKYISIRYYSMGLLACGLVTLALNYVIYGTLNLVWVILSFVALLGLLINCSVSVILNNELILKYYKISFFDTPKTKEFNNSISLSWSIIVGALVGGMYLVPKLQLVFIALIIFCVILAKEDILIFSAVVLFPFLPTMVLVGIMLFAVCLKFFKGVMLNNTHIKIDVFDIAVFGMICFNIFGVLNSKQPIASLKIALVYISFILFFFILKQYLAKGKNFIYTINCFIISATAVSGYGIIEQLFGLSQTTWQDEEMFEEISGRVCSTFENPNVLGEYLLITIPITLAMLYFSKEKKEKLLYLISAFMQGLCMIFTYSRGCWLGLMFSLAIFFVLCSKKVFTALTAGVFILPFVVPQTIVDRLLSIGNTADTSTAYRVYIWQGTTNMLKDIWLTGIGLGSEAFNSVYPRYAYGAITAPHPHNLFLLILSETGILGMILFTLCIFSFFRATGFVSAISEKYRTISIGLACGMGGYLLQGMFDNVWYNYRIYALFFIIMGFAAALKYLARREAE